MTAKEAYEKVYEELGIHPKTICVECEKTFSFRMGANRQIFIIKDTGDVIWEDDLPEEYITDELGECIPIE